MNKIQAMWNDETGRYEVDNVDVDGGLGGAKQWSSKDGDNWYDELGRPACGDVFDTCEIWFLSGPRSGEVVS